MKTPDRGNNELNDDISVKSGRVRKKGGGRKSVLKKKSEINEVFLEVVHENTAGSPMDEKIKRTNPSRPRIAELLARKGYKVSVPVVGQLLKKHNFRRRKASETVKGGESRYGNEQFPNISELCPNIRKQVCRF